MFMSMGYITHVKFTVVLFNINTTFMLNIIKNSNCQFLFDKILSFKGLKTDTSNYACTYISLPFHFSEIVSFLMSWMQSIKLLKPGFKPL